MPGFLLFHLYVPLNTFFSFSDFAVTWIKMLVGRAQALNVPYEILSASHVNAAYREFIIGNHGPDVVKHLFPSIEAQLEGRDCVICRSSGCSPADGKSVDLLLAGSPCDPYSIQRAKRFKPGAVLDHGLCGVTMDKVVNMFRVFEPKVGVLEQVRGFEMPLEQGSAESPCERLGVAAPCRIHGLFVTHMGSCQAS